jgi:hypothetical protein
VIVGAFGKRRWNSAAASPGLSEFRSSKASHDDPVNITVKEARRSAFTPWSVAPWRAPRNLFRYRGAAKRRTPKVKLASLTGQ